MHARAKRFLVVTAVDRERAVVESHLPAAGEARAGIVLIAGGIGRSNAAAATTEAILRHGPFDGVLSAGIAGALPEADGAGPALPLGAVVLASACVYVEEGLAGPEGFLDMRALGGGRLRLGDFEGNVVPVDDGMLARATGELGARCAPTARAARDPAPVLAWAVGPVATVATCSGTDAAALEVLRRTQAMAGGPALAEAMEGAAVVHAARRLGVPAIEIRAISNNTGDRQRQRWDIELGLASLGRATGAVLEALSRAVGSDSTSG